jgi:hypothetical protein
MSHFVEKPLPKGDTNQSSQNERRILGIFNVEVRGTAIYTSKPNKKQSVLIWADKKVGC